MKRGYVVTVLAVFVLIATAGCIGGGEADVGTDIVPEAEPVETDETGGEILSASLETTENIDTYRINSETHMDLASLFGLSVEMDTTGKFDRNERSAYTSTDGNQTVGFLGMSGGGSFETEVYRSQDTRQVRKSNESVTGDWEKVSSDSPLPLSLEGLSGTVGDADATVEGVSEVNGTEAYVLSLDVQTSSLGEAFSRTMETHGAENLEGDESGTSGEISEENINVSESYLWVDRETDRPLRFAYIVNLDIESDEDSDLSGSVEFVTDTKYTDCGDEVEIEFPEGVNG
jgi:hypothetical protein